MKFFTKSWIDGFSKKDAFADYLSFLKINKSYFIEKIWEFIFSVNLHDGIIENLIFERKKMTLLISIGDLEVGYRSIGGSA